MITLIGIDDTDNLESRGTGHLARSFAGLLMEEGLADVKSVTRHQLFFDPRIPYTSHNSSLCIYCETAETSQKLFEQATAYVAEHLADGSDAGVCVGSADQVHEDIQTFGARAKREVLTQDEARDLVTRHDLLLAGLSGTEDGVIGAVAALGLRINGRDGRCPWVRGIREMPAGAASTKTILEETGVEAFRDINTNEFVYPEEIELDGKARPVMIDGQPTLLVKEVEDGESRARWSVADKTFYKRY
jgi:hypothetical protein